MNLLRNWIVWIAALGLVCGCAGLAPHPAGADAQAVSPDQARSAARHAALGDAYEAQHRRNEAVAEWNLAHDLDPREPDAAGRLAGRGAPGPTVGSPETPPADLNARITQSLQQAEKNYSASLLKEADVDWRGVLTLSPGCPQALAGLERLKAETYTRDEQRPFDRMTEDLYSEGMRLFRRGELERAETKLADAAKLNPEQPQVKMFWARIKAELRRAADEDQARQIQEQARAAEADRDWIKAHALWQQAAARSTGAGDAAAGISRTAAELTTACAQLKRDGQRALARGEDGAALTAFNRVLEVFPDDSVARVGAKQARAGMDARQRELGGKIAAENHYRAGLELEHQGDAAGAIREWEAAVAAEPGRAEWQERLAQARSQASEDKEKKRRRAQARYEDGLAAYQRGELDAALAAWKETLEIDPDHAKAKANIRRVEQELK